MKYHGKINDAKDLITREYAENGFVQKSEVVDNVESAESAKALSANQGKVLKGLIDGMAGVIKVKVAEAQPSEPANNTIYFIGSEPPYSMKLYTTDEGWTYLGETSIDLSDYLKTSDVIDNLTSTLATKPLSANQGRVLNESIAGLTGVVQVEIVDELPETKVNNTIYYVGEEAPYEIYLYTTDGGLTSMGTSEIDLSQYAKLTDLNSYLLLAGGTMAGALNMGGKKVENVANASTANDAVNLQTLNNVLAGFVEYDTASLESQTRAGLLSSTGTNGRAKLFPRVRWTEAELPPASGASTSTAFSVCVFRNSATYGAVVAVRTSGDNEMFISSLANGTWADWRRVLTTDGGLMTGNLVFSGTSNPVLKTAIDSGAASVSGGTDSTSAIMELYGKGNTAYPGAFRIVASNETDSSALLGKPDGTLTWNSMAIATMQSLAAYLPLAGGAMAGAITGAGDLAMKAPSQSGALKLIGGSSTAAGAVLNLYGQTGAQVGGFELQAFNGNTSKTLLGKPDGTLTWGGEKVTTGGSLSDYLPLSGGTMTGALTMDDNSIIGSPALIKSTNGTATSIFGVIRSFPYEDDESTHATRDALFTAGSTTAGAVNIAPCVYFTTDEAPSGEPKARYCVLVFRHSSSNAHMVAIRHNAENTIWSCVRSGGAWGDWCVVANKNTITGDGTALAIKSTTFSGTTGSSGAVALSKPSGWVAPVNAVLDSSSGGYFAFVNRVQNYVYVYDAAMSAVTSTAVSGTIYYLSSTR